MENTNQNSTGKVVLAESFDEDRVYSVVRNKTKNQKVVLASLNGMEIAPGETVNLRAAFRKAQLIDAAADIYHFVAYGALEDLSGKNITPVQQEQSSNNIREDLQKKIQEVKTRDLLNEIKGCTLLTRLEDILTNPETPVGAKKEAKLRYMQLRGWVDEDYKLIPGASDDNNEEITSVESWEFQPFDVPKQQSITI